MRACVVPFMRLSGEFSVDCILYVCYVLLARGLGVEAVPASRILDNVDQSLQLLYPIRICVIE